MSKTQICICFIFIILHLAPCFADQLKPIELRADDSESRLAPVRAPGSEIKIFLPSLPYLAITHSINGFLVKPSDSAAGWEYELAIAHRKINETTFEFDLRHGVRFQDGTSFDADSALLNLAYFKKKPFTYSKLCKIFDHAEKIDQYKIRIHLSEKYGMLINDLTHLPFYTEKYLKKYGWNGKPTAANLAEPGPYGAGPYILESGYAEGDRHTPEVVLRANPYYWDKQYPKVEKVTVYTELKYDVAQNSVLYHEGWLDISVMRPEDKIETILAPYSKLVTASSTDNITIHINTISPSNENLKKKEIRLALNEAINHEMLINYAYNHEAIPSVASASPLFPGVSDIANEFLNQSTKNPYIPETQLRLKHILNGQKFKVMTQEKFLPLWRGIETQLSKVGVTLELDVRLSETEIFDELLTTSAHKNKINWDFLVWGNDDWFSNHPWTALFVFRGNDNWSRSEP